jgi:hypothetical protein
MVVHGRNILAHKMKSRTTQKRTVKNTTYGVNPIGVLHRSEPGIALHEFSFIKEGLGGIQEGRSLVRGTLLPKVDEIHARPLRNPYWFLKRIMKILNVGNEPGRVRSVPIWGR